MEQPVDEGSEERKPRGDTAPRLRHFQQHIENEKCRQASNDADDSPASPGRHVGKPNQP